MTDFSQVAADEAVTTTVKALEANNFKVTVVADAAAAKEAVLAAIPKGAEVLTMTSRTLDDAGITAALDESNDYDAVRPRLNAMMGDPTKKAEQRRLGAAPEYAIGSVHAITEGGEVLIASNTGSQLPAYAYAAGNVVWVVGTQKIVKDMPEAYARLEQHVFPLEDERAQQAYGVHTNISKVLTISKEVVPERIHIILVNEALGF